MKAQITTLALCAMTLAACNYDKDDAPQPANSGEIVIDASVGEMTQKKALKLGTTFDTGDAISVYAWTGSSSAIDAENLQVNNAINTLGDDGKWTATPKMLWKDGQSKHYFLGVYPQKAITNFTADEYALNTADQEASDVLVATNLDGISYRSTSVPLTFKHIMSVLHVNINYANFSTEPTEAIVKVNAKTNATINYLTKSVTPTGDNSDIVLPAIETVDGYKFSYKSILIPQSGIKEIVIRIGDQSFAYVPQKGITLKSGCYTTINMTIRRNEITNDNVSIVDWNKEEPIDVDALEKGDDSSTTDPTTDPESGTITDPNEGPNQGPNSDPTPAPTPSGELTELGATFTAVDLGLPSGLKWANMNIGATKPEDYGDYFAWGETETKASYYKDNSNYKFYKTTTTTQDADGLDVITSGYTKYCSKSYKGCDGFTDALTTLELSDDVANAMLGGNWRMPTKADWQELKNNCTIEWRQLNGANGYKVTSPNGKFIFLPAAGYRSSSYFNSDGHNNDSQGYYWSSSLTENDPSYAWYLWFNSDDFSVSNHTYGSKSTRNNGCTIRAVYPAE